ncbi:VaFE repeat-containing surface-anchored protein, partial [Arcanobacterium bovis]
TLYLQDGTPLLGEDGKPVTVTSKFTPKTADECANVTIRFDASKLAGKSVVVFEDVKRDGQTIATHHDVNDKAQTVSVVETPKPVAHAALAITGSSMPFVGAASGSLLALGLGLLKLRRKQLA